MTGTPQRIGWAAVVGLLLAWVVAGFIGALVGNIATGTTDDEYAAPGVLFGHVALPALLGLVVGVIATTVLRWWGPVWHEPLRMRAWGWIFPIAMVVGGAAFADWSRIANAGAALLAVYAATVVLIAASEELMFRGVVLQAMRDKYHEGVAALLATILFAVMHVLVGGGLGNIAQGVGTLIGGYLYYVTRRVSGGLLAPIVVHAIWDFTALSVLLGSGSDTDTKFFETTLILAVLATVALALWRPLNRVGDRSGAAKAEGADRTQLPF